MERRHALEFARAIRNHNYEMSPEGVLFPDAKVYIRGLYSFRTNKGPWEDEPNLLPTEGLNWLLDNLIAATGVPGYMSMYATAASPAAGTTQATYPGAFGEITSGSEGHTETTRVLWNAAAAASATKDNYASPSVFTIITAGTLVVNGVAMSTTSAKGATTGKLISATRFGAARSFSNNDEFDVKYRLSMTSS